MKFRNALRNTLIFSATILCALGAGWYVGTQPWVQQETTADPAVRLLLQQTWPDPQGRPQALAQWRDQLLVVNFWATWCAPCVEEMPELARLQHDFKNQPVQFIGVGIDTAANVQVFLRAHPEVDYPLLLAGVAGVELSQRFGNATGGLPYTVVIDGQGKIRHRHSGRISATTLTAWLHALLRRP